VHQIEIMYHKIKEIIIDHFGFRIWTIESGQIYSFEELETEKVNNLVNTIRDQASRNMKVEIMLSVQETSNSNIVFVALMQGSSASDNQKHIFMVQSEAFRINRFGDLIDVTVALSDAYIFEIIGGKIQNRINIARIQTMIRDEESCNRLKIEFSAYDSISYIFRSEVDPHDSRTMKTFYPTLSISWMRPLLSSLPFPINSTCFKKPLLISHSFPRGFWTALS
jgi:hypothetical protein